MEPTDFLLTRDDLRAIARVDVLQRGEHLFFSGRVEQARVAEAGLAGRVRGNRGVYDVELATRAAGWRCSCGKGQGRWVDRRSERAANDACKHVVALGCAWLYRPGAVTAAQPSAGRAAEPPEAVPSDPPAGAARA